jgi:2-oxoglutarate ferredoxin oxidoreductase subunit delta
MKKEKFFCRIARFSWKTINNFVPLGVKNYFITMAKIKGTVVVDTERCKGCNLCVVACPSKVLTLSKQVNGKGYSYCTMANPDDCVGCASCALVCPDSCLTVYRQKDPSAN